MKFVWMVAVLVCVVLTSTVFAQALTPRSMGMGGAAIGVADDGGAWFQNPAGLAGLNLSPQDDKSWANDIIGAYGESSDNGFGVTWSGFRPAKAQGYGAGYFDLGGGDAAYGVGFGTQWKDSPLSLGISAVRWDPDFGDQTSYPSVGFLYKFVRADAAPVRLGLVVRDVTDRTNNGPYFDFGVAWPVSDSLLVAADFVDATDEVDSMFNFGAEYVCGAANEWALRAGSADSDLTVGAGYKFGNNWRADFAWADTAVDSTWSISAGFGF